VTAAFWPATVITVLATQIWTRASSQTGVPCAPNATGVPPICSRLCTRLSANYYINISFLPSVYSVGASMDTIVPPRTLRDVNDDDGAEDAKHLAPPDIDNDSVCRPELPDCGPQSLALNAHNSAGDVANVGDGGGAGNARLLDEDEEKEEEEVNACVHNANDSARRPVDQAYAVAGHTISHRVPAHIVALATSPAYGVSLPAPPRVYIIGEDHMRMQPLLKELQRRGVPTQVWNTEAGALDPTVPPPPGVFFCRQSPSAGCREHASSIPYAKQLLAVLDLYGACVINGSRALEVETSKALQLAILHACGLNTPRTLLCQGLYQVQTEARYLPPGVPLICKPNTGGSGTGIDSFESAAQLYNKVQYDVGSMLPHTPDGLWLVQAYLGAYTNEVTAVRSIVRMEVVDGRVQRDYFIKITAPAKEFSLCPCDPRSADVLSRMQFMIIKDPLTIPGFRDDPEALDAFCAKVEAAFRLAGSAVGSIEVAILVKDVPEQAGAYPTPHEPVVFDFNTCNTNYNTLAEEAAEIEPGVSRVARMLADRFYALYGSAYDDRYSCSSADGGADLAAIDGSYEEILHDHQPVAGYYS
jgi:hypothetical protein